MNKSVELPVCYFPTRVLLVDDDAHFLKAMQSTLFKQDIVSVSAMNGAEARAIVKQQADLPIMSELMQKESSAIVENDGKQEGRIVDFDSLLTDSSRFDVCSVAVIDYSMPGESGLELCRSLQSDSIKKVLITGEADADIAIGAFNEGIIDKFIFKQDDDLQNKVSSAIIEMRHHYFLDISKAYFASANIGEHSFFCDPTFKDFFLSRLSECKAVEYYLLDDSGSYVLADKAGQLSYLLVKDKSDMEILLDLVSDSDYAFPERAKQIKQYQSFPYFRNFYDIDLESESLDLLPAETLTSTKGACYYYNISNFLPNNDNVENNAEMSFSQYLARHSG